MIELQKLGLITMLAIRKSPLSFVSRFYCSKSKEPIQQYNVRLQANSIFDKNVETDMKKMEKQKEIKSNFELILVALCLGLPMFLLQINFVPSYYPEED